MNTDIMDIDLLLQNLTYSEEGYSSLNAPFFIQDRNNKIINTNKTIITSGSYDEFKDKIPYELQCLYEYINNADVEAYSTNCITFWKWSDILSYYKAKCSNGQKNVLDFALQYAGMGWVQLYFVNLENGKIYKRYDGGSNGYDREDNFNKICKWDGNTTTYTQCTFKDLIILNDEVISS